MDRLGKAQGDLTEDGFNVVVGGFDVYQSGGKRRKRLSGGNFVDRTLGTIGFSWVSTSFGLPLQPQVKRVEAQWKDLRRFAFATAVQRNRVNNFCRKL